MPGLSPGWPHDPDGNIGAREMVAIPTCRDTELGLQATLAHNGGLEAHYDKTIEAVVAH